MAEDLQWFKFSPLKWLSGKIRREKEKVQIAFLLLVCQYWKDGCNMTIEKAREEIGDNLDLLMKKRIVKTDGEKILIAFLDEQIDSVKDKSEQRRIAARTRWDKANRDKDAMQTGTGAMQMHANALQSNTSAMQNDAEREEKRRETREEERDRIAQSIFSDELFLDGLNRSYKGKDYRKAFDACWMYHSQGQASFEEWEWRKKLISWLGNTKDVNGIPKNRSKIH
jgi:hypothetical protein